jgi:5S rRNA maturation endonuclease (ribonuclease M5)
VVEDQKIEEASDALQAQFRSTIVKTTETILGELVQELTKNHHQHENAYIFLDNFAEKLESTLQSELTQISTKKLPVLLHQRNRSDHLLEYNRKRDSRTNHLQRFLPMHGFINTGFQELRMINFQKDTAALMFNQLYTQYIKYDKIALRILGRREVIVSIPTMPGPTNKQSRIKTLGDPSKANIVVEDSNGNSIAPKITPSLNQKPKSISETRKQNSKAQKETHVWDAQSRPITPALPQLQDKNHQKYWSAGHLRATVNRQGKF